MPGKSSDRVLMLEGSSNIRDIGGYATRDGKVTRWKTILRSASMDKLPPESQQRLAEHGVKYIVDLRDLWETEKFPNVFATSALIIYHHSPVIGVDSVNKAIQETKTLVEFYTLVLQQCGSQIRAVLEVIADQLPNGCVLIHCWAGKDRTGIVAALLLALAGVAPETIAEDYGLSYALLSSQIETWRTDVLQSGRNLEQFEEEVSSRPETMLATLDYLESNLGGVDAYLRAIGLSDTTIDTLRTHLIEAAD